MRIRRHRHITWEDLGGCVALLDPSTGRAHSLGDVASAVWLEANGGGVTLESLAELAGVRCGHEVTVSDVEEAVAVLHGLGVLEVSSTIDRRRLLTMGAAGIAAASVVTISLPSPAMAASGGGGYPDQLRTTESPLGFSASFDDVTTDLSVNMPAPDASGMNGAVLVGCTIYRTGADRTLIDDGGEFYPLVQGLTDGETSVVILDLAGIALLTYGAPGEAFWDAAQYVRVNFDYDEGPGSWVPSVDGAPQAFTAP